MDNFQLLYNNIKSIEQYQVLPFYKKNYIMSNLLSLLRLYINESNQPIYEITIENKGILWNTLYILNKFIIEDYVLTVLFSYLCSLDNPILLVRHSSIVTYNTPDIIPIPHYHFIKDCMLIDKKTVGMYSYHTFHVFYMIGRVFAFVVSLQNKATYYHIVISKDTDKWKKIDILPTIKEMLPAITF